MVVHDERAIILLKEELYCFIRCSCCCFLFFLFCFLGENNFLSFPSIFVFNSHVFLYLFRTMKLKQTHQEENIYKERADYIWSGATALADLYPKCILLDED